MVAVALVPESADRKSAASSCGMDRRPLRDWLHRYNEEGLEGLAGRRRGVTHSSTRRRRPCLPRLGFGAFRCARTKSDPQAREAFESFAAKVQADLPDAVRGKKIEVWCRHKARVGRQGAAQYWMRMDPHLWRRTGRAGTVQGRCAFPITSRSCRCRPTLHRSTLSKTSGPACAPTRPPSPSSTHTTISSTAAAKPGTSSPTIPPPSVQSQHAIIQIGSTSRDGGIKRDIRPRPGSARIYAASLSVQGYASLKYVPVGCERILSGSQGRS